MLCAALALALAGGAAPAWTQQPAQDGEQVESKVIWGLLIQFAVSKLSSSGFEIFLKWIGPKLTGGTDGVSSLVQANLFRDSGARIVTRGAEALPVSGQAAAPAADVVVGDPERPLRVESGQENYQGVHIALMMAQDGGKSFVFRPVSEGFRSGERFKLRVVATFAGELTIDNINPRGERRRLYPPRADQVVTLPKSSETLLPLGADQYFEFGGATGREQLVISVADPRAVGAAAARTRVYRQDTKFGSNFLQEVAPDSYPLVQQAVELVHAAR
jgi:hypothetical protein